MYGHGATFRSSGAKRPTPNAPTVAANAVRHQASHVRSAAIAVRWIASSAACAGVGGGSPGRSGSVMR